MTNALYEAINLTREQAEQVAEELGGSVIWAEDHAHPTGTVVIRPRNCACKWCVAYGHSNEPEKRT